MQIEIKDIILMILISFISGALAGFLFLFFKSRPKIKELNKKIEILNFQIEETEKEFLMLSNDIKTNGEMILKQQEKIAAIKEKAQAVRDEKKPDNINDLIKLF